MRTRTGLALAAVVTLAAGCAQGGEQTTTPDAEGISAISMAADGSATLAPAYVGVEEGIFEKHGIELEMLSMAGAPASLSALNADSLSIVGQTPTTVAQAREQGIDVQAFCTMNPVDWTGYIALADSPLPTAEEVGYEEAVRALEGKTIGIAARGSGTEIISNATLESVGMSPEDVNYVAVGFGEGALTNLYEGNVDALVTYPFMTQQGAERTKSVLDLATDAPAERYEVTSAVYFAKSSWLEANPDLALAWCDALQESMDFVIDPANWSAVEPVIERVYGIREPEVMDAVLADDGPLSLIHAGPVDCDGLQTWLEMSRAGGLIEQEHSCDEIVWDHP